MRIAIVDTFATVFFFTTAATLVEYFVGGLEPKEILVTRSAMIPLMIITGRPYGIWRDRFFRTFAPLSSIARTLADVAAFVSFQLPIYALTLVIAGADRSEILTLLPATALAMVLGSRPFGLFLEGVRRLAGVRPVR